MNREPQNPMPGTWGTERLASLDLDDVERMDKTSERVLYLARLAGAAASKHQTTVHGGPVIFAAYLQSMVLLDAAQTLAEYHEHALTQVYEHAVNAADKQASIASHTLDKVGGELQHQIGMLAAAVSELA